MKTFSIHKQLAAQRNKEIKQTKNKMRKKIIIKMAFRWRVDDDPKLNTGLVALWFSGDPDQYC